MSSRSHFVFSSPVLFSSPTCRVVLARAASSPSKRAMTVDNDIFLTPPKGAIEKGGFSPRFSPTSPSKRQRWDEGDISLVSCSPRGGIRFSHAEAIGTAAGASYG